MAETAVASSSDDEEYKAVDLISDSDEDEPDVEQAEERNIIHSEEEHSDSAAPVERDSSPQPSVDWEGFDLNDKIFSADLTELGNPFADTEPHFANEIELYNAASMLDHDSPRPGFESKRVRFRDDVPHSDSSRSMSTDGDDDGFPDLFMQQDSLDPHFRCMIEADGDADDGASGSTDGDGSYWDFRGSDDTNEDGFSRNNRPQPYWDDRTAGHLDRNVLDHIFDDEDSGSSNGSSSGYETDEGETTDEDLPLPSTTTRTRSVLRRPSTSSLSPDDENHPAAFRRSLHQSLPRRLGPSLGSWVADPSKPIAVIDSTGKRMVIYPAQRPPRKVSHPPSSGSSTMNTSPQTPHASLVDESDNSRADFSHQLYSASFVGSGANLMMGGLLHGPAGNEYLLGGQVLGPPEAFYPFRSIGSDGQVEDADEEYDDDDDEEMLNVHDFIDFGDGSSCGENDDGDEDESSASIVPVPSDVVRSSLSHLATAQDSSSSEATTKRMLDHFDRGVVTSFRRNQARHKLLLNRPLRGQMAAGLSSNSRAAIKGGRLAAANSPLSPKRKRKMSAPPGMSGHALGSLSGHGLRRSAGSSHKRHKSGLI